jgi:hypothetical protein
LALFYLFRSYDVCKPENLPEAVKTFITILRSDAMFVVLSSMTGLTLHEIPSADRENLPDGSDANKSEQ